MATQIALANPGGTNLLPVFGYHLSDRWRFAEGAAIGDERDVRRNDYQRRPTQHRQG